MEKAVDAEHERMAKIKVWRLMPGNAKVITSGQLRV